MSASKIDLYFSDYASYHVTRGNRITHYLGIPMIIIGILGLLDRVMLIEHVLFGLPLTLAMLVFVAASLFYIYLHQILGVAMVVALSGLYWLSLKMDVRGHIFLFVVGWILQLYGHHHFEKNRPAFLSNLTHLLIGPFYILNKFVPIYRKKTR